MDKEPPVTDYYASDEPDLKNKFGTMRGQISYGILDVLLRSRNWAVLFTVLLIVTSVLATAKPWLSKAGIQVFQLPADRSIAIAVSTFVGIGILALAIYLLQINSSLKRVAQSADATEVELLLKRLRNFWRLGALFLLLVLALWVGLPIAAIR